MYDAKLLVLVDTRPSPAITSHTLWGEIWRLSPITGKPLLVERGLLDTDRERIIQTQNIAHDMTREYIVENVMLHGEDMYYGWYSGASVYQADGEPFIVATLGTHNGRNKMVSWLRLHPIMQHMDTRAKRVFMRDAEEKAHDMLASMTDKEDWQLDYEFVLPNKGIAYALVDYATFDRPDQE